MLEFNVRMTRLVEEVVRVLPEFHFIDLARVRVSSSSAHSNRRSGLVAYLLPLKYKDGRPVERKIRGRHEYHYGMVPVMDEGVELLYLIYFLLPRFLNLTLREKLETVIHELFHINPAFNGDVRRLPGRSHLHGHSHEDYDRNIRRLTEKFLSLPHDSQVYACFKGNATQIRLREGDIVARHRREPRPTLLKVSRVGIFRPPFKFLTRTNPSQV